MNNLELIKNANVLRKLVIKTIYGAKSGHIGGSLSSAEILTALYFKRMKLDEKNARWEDHDRFVLSKGHITPAYYSVLAMRGFFPISDLETFRKNGSKLQGHPRIWASL